MSQLERTFTLAQLLQASRAIARDKQAGKTDFRVYAAELDQLAYHFNLNPEEICENIEAIISQLEKIVKTQESYDFDFSSHVPPSFLRYWQERAREVTENREQIDQLVENEIASWIAGQKEKYARENSDLFPEGEVPPPELSRHLESEKRNVEARLAIEENRIKRILSPFERNLKRKLETILSSQAPKDPRVIRSLSQAAGEIAQKTRERISRSPEIKDRQTFRNKLEEVLEEEVLTNPAAKTYFPRKEIPSIAADFSAYYPDVARSLGARAKQEELIGHQINFESATNLPLQELPPEISEQIQPERGKTLQDIKNEIADWLYTQGYPTQTLIKLVKSEYPIIKGPAKVALKTIKEGLLPGLTLREQFFRLLAMGPEGLMATEWDLAVRAWYDYAGEKKFKEEFEPWGALEPKDWQKIPYQIALELKERIKEELKAVKSEEKTVSFKEREILLTYNRLFEFLDLIKQFQEKHPFLAGTLHRFSQVFSWPARHPHIMLAYHLSKSGPYAPRLITEFYTGWFLQTAFTRLIVRLTERFPWGWKRKYIPLLGWKTVWKPTEKLKGWIKKKLFGFSRRILRKIGLEKLALKIAGFFSGWGTVISIFWKDIKKAFERLLASFLIVLLTWGKAAATGFAIGSMIGIGVCGFFGFQAFAALGAKIGGTIGAAILGPVGAIFGGIIGGFLFGAIGAFIALGLQKLAPGFGPSITVPFTAPTITGAAGLGGPGIITQATAALPNFVAPVLLTTGATVVGGSLLLNVITSSAFVIPEEMAVPPFLATQCWVKDIHDTEAIHEDSVDEFINHYRGLFPHSLLTRENFDLVVTRSQEVGFNPALAIAIWGEESHFGNYEEGITPGHDFGCAIYEGVSSQDRPQTFEESLACFVADPDYSKPKNTCLDELSFDYFMDCYGPGRDHPEHLSFVDQVLRFYLQLDPDGVECISGVPPIVALNTVYCNKQSSVSSVRLACKIEEIINYRPVTRSSWPSLKEELAREGIPAQTLDELEYSVYGNGVLQCVGFKIGVEESLDNGDSQNACQFLRYPGIPPEEVKEGDNAVWGNPAVCSQCSSSYLEACGHIGLVSQVIEGIDGRPRYVDVTQAWGDRGIINTARFPIDEITKFIRW